jgi:hypothetical protein
MNEKRDTVGKISSELLKQESPTNSAIELEREMHTEYDKNILECVDSGRKQYHGVFYVVVITKRERLMPNVFRNYFFARETCPTPDWDQAVYRYMKSADAIEFLWVIPSKDTCEHLKENALHVTAAEKQLLNFVLDFSDGTLLNMAKKLNKEREHSPLLEK